MESNEGYIILDEYTSEVLTNYDDDSMKWTWNRFNTRYEYEGYELEYLEMPKLFKTKTAARKARSNIRKVFKEEGECSLSFQILKINLIKEVIEKLTVSELEKV